MTMTQERKTFRPVTSSGVCEIYNVLHERGIVSFPITSEAYAQIEAIVANVTAQYFDVELYPSPEQKAVAYLYFLIKDHPFTDGNKRTASLVFEVVCALNELEPDYTEHSLDTIAVYVEKADTGDHHALINALVAVLFVSK